MQRMMRKYLKILDIELDDLQSDIEILIGECNMRKERGEITDYVFLENLAVLKNGIHAIHAFHEMIEGLDPDQFPDLNMFIQSVKDLFKSRLHDCSMAEGINRNIEIKLDNVFAYVSQQAGSPVPTPIEPGRQLK
jgi:hypothetical protein